MHTSGEVAKLAYHANCWGPLGGNAVGVTSIAQLTYRTFGDMERRHRRDRRARLCGRRTVRRQSSGLRRRAAARSRSALSAAGVKLVAAYSGANFIFPDILDQELARIARVADAAAGSRRRASRRRRRREALRRAARRRPRASRRRPRKGCRPSPTARGLRAHYHPHLSTIVEGPAEVDKIFALTSIDFCPDTAHLAAAGGDVPAMIRKHRDAHFLRSSQGLAKEPFAFTPLDEGDLDMRAIMRALADINFDGWIAAELDAWPDPKDGAAKSLAFLRKAPSRESLKTQTRFQPTDVRERQGRAPKRMARREINRRRKR